MAANIESMGRSVEGPPPVPLEEKALIQRVVESDLPSRPSYGSIGRRMTVLANHYSVDITDFGDIFHYDIAIGRFQDKNQNVDMPTKLRHVVIEAFFHDLPGVLKSQRIATDKSRNIYAPKKLPFKSQRFHNIFPLDVKNGKKEHSYWVEIRETSQQRIRIQELKEMFEGRSALAPREAIKALDVALRHTASQKFTTIGRSLYQRKGFTSLGSGADLWLGYYQSLRPTQSGLTLNVDSAATPIVKSGSVIDFLVDVLGMRGQLPKTLSPNQIQRASRALRGIQINITHRDTERKYRINQLSGKSAAQLTFAKENGDRQSVAEYFRKNYGGLQFPHLPCVQVGSNTSDNYLPLEVCEIFAGQRYTGKLNERQVAAMIKATCQKPELRKRNINTVMREDNFTHDKSVRDFHLKVQPHMMQVSARLLPEPEIAYGGNRTVRPVDGSWNSKGQKFSKPAVLQSWAVISFCDPERTPNRDIDKFVDSLMRHATGFGIRIPRTKPTLIGAHPNDPIDQVYGGALMAAQKKFKATPQLVLCILPDFGGGLYSGIKRASDSHFGIISQCMLSRHIPKCSMQYLDNLVLKINVKLGGRNSTLNKTLPKFSDVPTIVFGADVTHPVGADTTRPSIAAVTASMDEFCSTHYGVIREQRHRQEIIEDLEDMTIELLKMYYQAKRQKPQRLIFYRDGVSEGQFQQVLDLEMKSLQRAFERLEIGYKPQVTLVIVQKRHHTRFFPIEPRDMDRSGNLRAGTLIETEVCHPLEFDFYLMSHGGIQGTSRPSHYHVLLDENEFTPDELQTLTFDLCHNYVRCTKSVSIVPAVYYAHLLAFRARYLSESTDSKSDSRRLHHVHKGLIKSMFFA